jgi:hypothetical protein
MAKSSKKSMDAASDTAAPIASSSEVPADAGQPPARKTRAAKSTGASKKTTRKQSGAASRKTTPQTKPRQLPSRKKAAPSQVAVSDDDIRLRAYFLAEERMRKGIEGNSGHDWLEARRQLLAEAAGRA